MADVAAQTLFYNQATFWLGVVGTVLLVINLGLTLGTKADMARHIATCAQYLGLTKGFTAVLERRRDDNAQAVARIEQKVDQAAIVVQETKQAALNIKAATDSAMLRDRAPEGGRP